MRKIAFLAALLAVFSCGSSAKPNPEPTPEPGPEPTPTIVFAKGADISWASEMEAGGRKFKKKDGTVAPLLDVLKDCGFNSIRLRVWVNPYEGWSGKGDVMEVARKVKAAGMALMVDFHYSDFFADPSRQLVPSVWKADASDVNKMAAHVADHTKDVLSALKNIGVEVKWIQIGNETRGGMLYPAGQLNYDNKGAEFYGFLKLYNAGYDAAKAIYPDAFVMPHLNNAFDSSNNAWWFGQFKAQGGKCDMVALSHYPQYEPDPSGTNSKAVSYIKSVAAAMGVPVMISEVGVKSRANEASAKSLLKSFMDQVSKLEQCAGVFYWEPEVDGVWKPEIYTKPAELSKYSGKAESGAWNAYDQGAFTTDGKPTSVLDVFAD